jgi:hypothetical protein
VVGVLCLIVGVVGGFILSNIYKGSKRQEKKIEDTRLNVARRIRNFLEKTLSSEKEDLGLYVRFSYVPEGWGVFLYGRASVRPYLDIRVSKGMILCVPGILHDSVVCSTPSLSENEIKTFLLAVETEAGEFLRRWK